MQRTEIAPGAHLTVLPGEKFKRCNIAVHLVVPGERENATALALLPHLLDRRCEAFPDPEQLARHLFALYGADVHAESYTAGPSRVVSFIASGLQSAYALEGEDLASAYLNLVCQMLFRPKLTDGVFDETDVAIEKEKQADYLRSEVNDKRDYCLRQARRKLYGTSPLGIESPGYLEDIDALGAKELFAAYKTLLRTAAIEVVCCGLDAAHVTETLQGYLATTERAPKAPLPLEGFAGPGEFAYYTEPMDTVQGKLCMMFTSGHISDARGAAVMRVANALLGGTASSRLFVNVREKQSLCYYCASGYGAYGGTLTMDSGVEHKNCEKAAAAMLHELEVLQAEPVSDEELGFAHKALIGAFTTVQDSPDALCNWAFGEWLRGTNLSLEAFIALVGSVTKEEVRDALAAFKPAVQYAITAKEGA